MGRQDGSITIFMTFVFLILFGLTAAALDSARYFGAGGYVRASAHGARLAITGEYNRELFSEYALLAYGGFDGKGQDDWLERYREILQQNLAERPEEGGESLFEKRYASVYQISGMQVELQEAHMLSEEKYFLKQLKAWMAAEGLEDISGTLLGRIRDTDQGKQTELLDSVGQNEQMEKQQKEKAQAAKDNADAGKKEDAKKSQNAGNQKESGEPEDASKGETESPEKETSSGENPLKFIRELLRDGVLSLVCDENGISELEVVSGREPPDAKETNQKAWYTGKSGSSILKKLLCQSDSLWNDEMREDSVRKGTLLLYASERFGSYVADGKAEAPYGMEYLLTGKRNQKDAFAEAVNRLFLIRTLINFLYVEKSPALQAQSLETATAIAAAMMAEAFIPAIQTAILLVLAVEESCVDITALLERRRVPVCKNASNFQMRYAEICLAGRQLFRTKAQVYPEIEGNGIKPGKDGLGYQHYLWLMLLMNPWDVLYDRTLSFIQYDLRTRYNATFTIDECVCKTKTTLCYEMPFLTEAITGGWITRRGQTDAGYARQEMSVVYG